MAAVCARPREGERRPDSFVVRLNPTLFSKEGCAMRSTRVTILTLGLTAALATAAYAQGTGSSGSGGSAGSAGSSGAGAPSGSATAPAGSAPGGTGTVGNSAAPGSTATSPNTNTGQSAIPGAVSPSNPNAASRPQGPNIGGSPLVQRPSTAPCGSGTAGTTGSSGTVAGTPRIDSSVSGC